MIITPLPQGFGVEITDFDLQHGRAPEDISRLRQAVIKLVMSGQLDNPRQDAESAATYLHAHCGQPESAPVIAARPSASSSSP